MNTLSYFPAPKLRIKTENELNQKRIEKLRNKQLSLIKDLTKDRATSIKLKATTSQLFCTTALQVELIDNLIALGLVAFFPSIKKFQQEMIELNTDLYNIAVKEEADDYNRLTWEKMMTRIVSNISSLNLKQLEILDNYTENLINKK